MSYKYDWQPKVATIQASVSLVKSLVILVSESGVWAIKSVPWILHCNCPSSCVRYLIMFLLLVQLMLCRAAAWVLNIEWEQVQALCKRTGEETNTNNKPYPALKCPSSPWMSAVPSFPCVHNSHSSQSLTTKWCRSTDYTIAYTIQFTCSIMYEF